jgi:hypothetical protein
MASSDSSSFNNHKKINEDENQTHFTNPALDKNYLSKSASSSRNNGQIICDDMIYYCFDVLNSHLHKNTEPPRKPVFTNNEFPLFVTW